MDTIGWSFVYIIYSWIQFGGVLFLVFPHGYNWVEFCLYYLLMNTIGWSFVSSIYSWLQLGGVLFLVFTHGYNWVEFCF